MRKDGQKQRNLLKTNWETIKHPANNGTSNIQKLKFKMFTKTIDKSLDSEAILIFTATVVPHTMTI